MAVKINYSTMFEDYVQNFLTSVGGFISRGKRNANTSSGTKQHDYDLIIYNDSTLFNHFGKYILVEAKNWVDPVGYEEIVKFYHKLKLRKCRVGIFVSMSGIVDGIYNETIREIYTSDEIVILTLTMQDLIDVNSGKENLCTLLRYRYEQIRFKLS